MQITYVNQSRYFHASHDYNIPSRFIEELPKEVIDIEDSNYFERKDFINEFSNTPEKFEDIVTPGRKRLLNRTKKNEITWDFNQDIFHDSVVGIGAKVFHKKYGYGHIIDTNGEIANVKFGKSNMKKIFTKYLKVSN